VEGPLGEIHETGPGHPCQGYGEVVGHDSLIRACREDGGGVDLQELGGVNHPVVLLWQVGPKLGRLDHHTQVWGQCHAPPRNSQGVRGEQYMCDLARTHWCMQVEVFLEVTTLDMSTPLTVSLDGGVTVFPTSTVVDFLSEVRRLIAGHRRMVLRRRVRTWQHRGHLCHGWRTHR
jgi:hypothetical protein